MTRLSDIPWSELSTGRVVSVESPTDVMGGVIARLEREPMVWIRWKDGNLQEYTQSVLKNVVLIDKIEAVDTNFVASSDASWGNAEGE